MVPGLWALRSKGVTHEASRDFAFAGGSLLAGGLLQLLQPTTVPGVAVHRAGVAVHHAGIAVHHAGIAVHHAGIAIHYAGVAIHYAGVVFWGEPLCGDVVLRHAADQQHPIRAAIGDGVVGRFAGRRRPVPGRRR